MQIPYLGLIQQILWACPSTPMILLEVPHVSLRLQLRAMSVDDVAHAAAQILWRHSYQEACFVAHSYGTFCASRICQLHRSLVHSMVGAPIQASVHRHDTPAYLNGAVVPSKFRSSPSCTARCCTQQERLHWYVPWRALPGIEGRPRKSCAWSKQCHTYSCKLVWL